MKNYIFLVFLMIFLGCVEKEISVEANKEVSYKIQMAVSYYSKDTTRIGMEIPGIMKRRVNLITDELDRKTKEFCRKLSGTDFGEKFMQEYFDYFKNYGGFLFEVNHPYPMTKVWFQFQGIDYEVWLDDFQSDLRDDLGRISQNKSYVQIKFYCFEK